MDPPRAHGDAGVSDVASPDSDRAGERVRLRLTVHGRVQGVWYRDSMRREAQRLGVAGWAENCPDGTVAAVLEGARLQVERLVDWCRRGPPAARVDRVESREETPCGDSEFRIRG